MKVTDFKKIYLDFEKKYSLPSFEEMNDAFDIGKIKRDSGNLIRDIRRAIIEKIVYYLKLTEIIMNPANASPIFLMLLKEVNSDDKKVIDSILNSFVELELEAHSLDITSSEKDEASLINKTYKVWVDNRDNLTHLIKLLQRNWKIVKNSQKKNRDYLN